MKPINISRLLPLLIAGMLGSVAAWGQQAQQVVFVAGDDPATPEIFIQEGETAFMYIQGGISAVNATSPAGESNVAAGSFSGSGTGNVVVNGALFIASNAGNAGDVRNATSSPFIFDRTLAAVPDGGELTGTLPALTGTMAGTFDNSWGGTVHMMAGEQEFAGLEGQANSDMRFYNLSLEGGAVTHTIVGSLANANVANNADEGDVETGVSTGAGNTGTLFLHGATLATGDNLAWARNPTDDDTDASTAGVAGQAIARLAAGSGGSGTSNPWGMSLTSQNSNSTSGMVTSTDDTRGRLGRTTTGGNYLFPTADESGFYRPTGLIGAAAGVYYARTQEVAGAPTGSLTPTKSVSEFFNVVNSNPAASAGEYRLYATIEEVNGPVDPASECADFAAAVSTNNIGTAQSEAYNDQYGFQQGDLAAPAGSADLGFTTSVSYPSTPIPVGCTGPAPRVPFIDRPTAGASDGATEAYVVASKPTQGATCYVVSATCNPLPVEIIYLRADAIDNQFIRVNWATASERNSKEFQVERSTNGRTFSYVNKVAAVGNSTSQQDYGFDDLDVLPNVTYYYRVKAVDKDLSYKYTNVDNAMLRGRKALSIINIVPNPVSGGNVNINVGAARGMDVNVNIYNNIGQLLYTGAFKVNEGNNQLEVPTAGFPFGSYHVAVVSDTESLVESLIVTR
jgi:hypothetical protein